MFSAKIKYPSRREAVAALILLAVAVGSRFLTRALHLPNTELLTLTAFLSPLLLRGRLRWMLPLLAVALSDLLITNSRYLALYIWSAWGVIGLAGTGLHKFVKFNRPASALKTLLAVASVGLFALILTRLSGVFSLRGELVLPGTLGAILLLILGLAFGLYRLAQKRLLAGLSFGIFSTLFFYLVTNFGVFQEGILYPPTTAGLVNCYIAGLPFLEKQLRANLILLPAGVALYELAALALSRRFSLSPHRS